MNRREFLKKTVEAAAVASVAAMGGIEREKTPEHVPSKEEVLFEIAKHCENPKQKRELFDSEGIYLLEVEVPGNTPGETIEYIYQRKGEFPNGSKAVADVINVTYFEDGIPVRGESVATYNPESKSWA